jgi:hypothetical protein
LRPEDTASQVRTRSFPCPISDPIVSLIIEWITIKRLISLDLDIHPEKMTFWVTGFFCGFRSRGSHLVSLFSSQSRGMTTVIPLAGSYRSMKS